MSRPTRECNIASHLADMARDLPDRPAVVTQIDDRALTFAELDERANRYANGFQSAGIHRGMRALVMIRPGLEFAAVVFALFKMGALPVMIDAGMGLRKLLGCVRQARPQALIGIARAQVARKLLRGAFRTVQHHVTVGRGLPGGGPTLEQLDRRSSSRFQPADTRADDPAAILFTSGSTGPPKGVLYEHGMFEAQVRSIQTHYGLERGEIELATFPLFALFCPALGMTCVFPEMDFSRPGRVDPARIVQAVEDYSPTNAFGSPALWDRVGRHCAATDTTLNSLRRILIAGAPVDWRIVQRLRSCLAPSAEIHTPYGATESLPVASVSGREILDYCAKKTRLGAGICVGKPIPDRRVRIVRISDQPIAAWSPALVVPDGEKGEIAVSGDVVTREYFELPSQTAAAKVRDDDAVWHRLGDIGYFDEQGRLWFCGRKSHRVRTAAGTLYPECCEAVFNEHPDVARSALVGVGEPQQQVAVIIVEARAGRTIHGTAARRLERELLSAAGQHAHTRCIERVLLHRRFPVDVRHNAKINREVLAAWAARRLR